ncbi:putative E3 ubiquitin-protein ligase ariadne-1 [Pelomyxa schiedti]|nr:putative E3 ubiquitin-protein ligase ariadne-1 [Pelomyxa schiedti]
MASDEEDDYGGYPEDGDEYADSDDNAAYDDEDDDVIVVSSKSSAPRNLTTTSAPASTSASASASASSASSSTAPSASARPNKSREASSTKEAGRKRKPSWRQDNDEDGADDLEAEDDDMDSAVVAAEVAANRSREDRGWLNHAEYMFMTEDEVVSEQAKVVSEATEIMQISPGTARMLLKKCKWDVLNLLQRWTNDGDKVYANAGVAPPLKASRPSSPPDDCPTCLIPCSREEMMCPACGHWSCKECWQSWISTNIDSNGLTEIKCMTPKCPLLVDEDMIRKIVPPGIFRRYGLILTKSFIQEHPYLKGCPAPGCTQIAKISEGPKSVALTCKCGKSFCFNCQFEPHAPATCSMVAAWQKKLSDDSETAKWLSANTKDCPTCHKATEKNGGCNHISCTCGAHWCWVCVKAFDASTVYSHNCNKYAASADASRQSLERYLHYVVRYDAHAKSKAQESSIMKKMESRIDELMHSCSWIELRFLESSLDQLFKCREILKYTYVFAYYLFEGGQASKAILMNDFRPFADKKQLGLAQTRFEDFQQQLETATEKLSALLESRPEVILVTPDFRTTVMDMTSIALKKFDAMFECVEWMREFPTGTWVEPTPPPAAAKKEPAPAKPTHPPTHRQRNWGPRPAAAVTAPQRRQPAPAEPAAAITVDDDDDDAILQEAIRQSLASASGH